MFISAVCVFCQTSVTRLTVCWFKIPAQQNNEKTMLALKMSKKDLKGLRWRISYFSMGQK